MKSGDLVIPKYPKDTSPVIEIEPELVLELDHMDDIIDGIRYGKRYAFWKVLELFSILANRIDFLLHGASIETLHRRYIAGNLL